uniref:Toxin candidate TRINITY_DN37438_c1_g1_i1 n=1 Tax=Pachycerianthus maua TaxID=2736681 RepID=A0A7G7WZ59_9CNID|nr:toxin candidate TRINITY_DN37438_c1_g1_i1 [Pachycerianthus maua]
MKCLFLVLGLLAVFAMKEAMGDVDSCYTCRSVKSWDDCNSNMKKTSCSGKCGSKTCDACQKTEGSKAGVTAYTKECSVETICEATEDICAVANTECKAWCCTGDDCNGVSGTMASLVVVTTALLTTIMITLY